MIEKWLEDPSKITVISLFALMVLAFYKEWIITGAAHLRALVDCAKREDQIRKERDEFKEMAMRGLELTRRSIEVVGKVKDTP